MPYRTNRPYLFRLSARILIFGLWTVMFGLLILYFAIQMLSIMSSTSLGVLGSAGGSAMRLDKMLVRGMLMLYRGGFLTLGVGGALMAFGSMFIISVVK